MKIACEKELNLSDAKRLIKAIKVNGGSVIRPSLSSDGALLKDNRGRSHTLLFKSNLKLMGLI